MKKSLSIIILIVLIMGMLIPIKGYAVTNLADFGMEDLETTFKLEGITDYDFKTYNKTSNKIVNIYIFRMNGCLNCKNLYKYYISNNLLSKYGDKINIVSFEIRQNSRNFRLMQQVKEFMGEYESTYYTPYVVIGNKTFSGDLVVENSEEKQSKMEQAINEQLNSAKMYDVIEILYGEKVNKKKIFPFKDVKNDDWYYDSVRYTYENNMIYGKTDTLFKPNDTLTRGMLATIIWRMEGSPKANGSKFNDVKKDQYYYEAVNWAVSKKIVSGYNAESFKPNNPITREQLAVMLHNYAKYKGKNVNKTTNLSNYKDAFGVASYSVEAVKWAIANKVINGKDNGTRIDPRGVATRAQVATILKNYCVNVGR